MSAVRVRVGPGDDPVALVRAAEGESVLLLMDPALDPPDMARARATVGVLAVERAPDMRVNAIVASAGARPADIEDVARFLEGARSTTGQVLEIGRASSRLRGGGAFAGQRAVVTGPRVRPQGPSSVRTKA